MDEGRIRKIIHIDMDAFYASVEQRDDPALIGRPVAVGHPGRRGVVAAASYEARRFGVRSAMPSTTAMRKCAELVFVPPRFDAYRAVSRQIHAVFREYTPLVEPLSLDEAYLDVTDNLKGLPTAWATAKEIRARIREETGLTASAGVSYNKLLAKLASDHRKPNGQFAIMPDEGEAFVAALPVAKLHGVGPVTAAKMRGLGIETGADLRRRNSRLSAGAFRQGGELVFRGRTRPRRPPGPTEPRAKIVGIGDDLSRGPDRSGPDRGRRSGDGRRRLGLVRKDRRARTHRDGQDQMGRLRAIDPQPLAGSAGRNKGEALSSRDRSRPLRIPAPQRRASRRSDSGELSTAGDGPGRRAAAGVRCAAVRRSGAWIGAGVRMNEVYKPGVHTRKLAD